EVRRPGPIRLALPEGHGLAAATDVAHELRHEARLAHPRLGRDADYPAVAGLRLLVAGPELAQLLLPPDEAEIEPGLAAGRSLEGAVERPDLDRGCLALDRKVRESLPDERLASVLSGGTGDVDP